MSHTNLGCNLVIDSINAYQIQLAHLHRNTHALMIIEYIGTHFTMFTGKSLQSKCIWNFLTGFGRSSYYSILYTGIKVINYWILAHEVYSCCICTALAYTYKIVSKLWNSLYSNSLSLIFQLQMKQLALAKQAAEARLVREIQQMSQTKDPKKLGTVWMCRSQKFRVPCNLMTIIYSLTCHLIC